MNPSQAQVIKDAIRAQILNMNTSIPAKVTAVDVAAGKCDCQPVIRKKYASGEVVDLPIITNVPIASYRAGQAFISLPLKVGDYVLLIFSQRSMDLWLTSGGSVDPKDPRANALKDAIAYPGVYPFSDPPAGATSDDIVMKNSQSTIVIKPSGEIVITAPVKVQVIAGDVEVQASGDVSVQCQNASVEAAAQATVQAPTIDMIAPTGINATTPILNVSGLIGCAGLAVGGTPVAGEANIAGDVHVTGSVDATGDVEDGDGTMDEMRTTYNGHTHPENGAGGGTTSPPNQPMT